MNSSDTLTQLYFDAIERFGSKRAAVRYKQNDSWHDITHRELERRVHHAAIGLMELGMQPGDRVAILSVNRPEWAIADFACLTARCTDVPIYPTIPPKQVSYIIKDSASCAIFVSGRKQFEKISGLRNEMPRLRHVITFDPDMDDPDILSLDSLCQLGRSAESKYTDYRDLACRIDPDEAATLIYTSGTTGPPKGVILTHRNIASNVEGALQVIPIGPDDSCLSLLPLSHSFERMAGHYTMFKAGVTINYAEDMDHVPANLLEVKPTVVLSVPRLFEKIYARVLENAMSGGSVKRRIFYWARKTADAWADLSLSRQAIPAGLAMKKRLADALVFSKLKARTGGRIRFFVSGGAPLAPEIARFFYAVGIPILEGYGLTESSPVIAVNPFDAPRIGTVGQPLPGVEVRIADDGEILARGPNIMKGYYQKPDATSEAVDHDGWLHTGDIGELDSDSYLRITDRKKDIIVTAGGKNIAPQPIENTVKTNKFVLNAMMTGDRRKFPSILIVPNVEALEKWAAERRILAKPDELLKQPDVIAKIEVEVMGSLRGLAHYQMPKKILIIEKDFTQEDGELTPTLKVKRRVVEQKYADLIEELYAE
ncbi:MAG: AMP-dependent synthetase/ligase [Gemmatimonadales bacterium]